MHVGHGELASQDIATLHYDDSDGQWKLDGQLCAP